MKKQCKKLITMLVAVALVLTSIAYQPTAAKAAAEHEEVLYEQGVATANTPVTKSCTVTAPSNLAIGIYVATPVDGTMEVKSSADGVTFINESLTASSWQLTTDGSLYFYAYPWKVTKSDVYNITLNFAADTAFEIVALQQLAPYLSSTSLTVTKGFSDQLTVVNADEDVTWTSSNTKVATVDSTGKVTGKKAGTATITAQLADGSYAQCAVTVQDNVYKEKQLSVSSTPSGSATMQLYNVAYKNGNLVLKTRLLNNTGKKVTGLENIRITIKNANGQVIGTYTAKKVKASVKAGKAKNYTFTIKKAKLKLKKTQDLTKITRDPISGLYKYQR